jgi:hypothetical protein
MRSEHRVRVAVSSALVLAALALQAVPAEAADAPLPSLRVRKVNDDDAAALAALRKRFREEVASCRALMGMPDAPPPELPDAQLAKIVFFEEIHLYSPKAAATFTTSRSVHADDQSHCEPFVWVARSASVFSDCDAWIGGHGMADPGLLLPTLAAKLEETTPPGAIVHPRRPGCTVPPRRQWNTAGLTPTDAGRGVKCVWASAVMKNNLGPIWTSTRVQAGAPPSDGTHPAPSGDSCVDPRWPFYGSPNFKDTPLVLRSFDPHKGDLFDLKGRGDTGEAALIANNHVVDYQEGAPIADAEVSLAAVSNFVKQGYREAMPAR